MKIKRSFYDWNNVDGSHGLQGSVVTSPGADRKVIVSKIIAKIFHDHPLIGWNPADIKIVSRIEEAKRSNPTKKILWGHKRGTEEWAEDIISRHPARFAAAKIWAAERGYDRFRVSTMDISRPPDFAGTVRRNPAAIKTLEPGSKSVDAYGVRYVGRGQLPRAIAIGRRFHWLAFKEPGHAGISKIGIQSGYGYIEFNGVHGKHWWMSTSKHTRQIAPPEKLITYIGEQIRDADYPRHNPRYEVKGSYQARGVKGQHFHSGLLTVDAPNKRLAERKARASGHYVFGHRFRPFRVREI